MSAQVIPFPSRAAIPEHWGDWEQHLFEHFRRCDGATVEQARERVEFDIHTRRKIPG